MNSRLEEGCSKKEKEFVARDWGPALDTPEDLLNLETSPSNGYFRVEAQLPQVGLPSGIGFDKRP